MNFPLAGLALYKELYGCDPPPPILPKDSTVALLMHDDPQTVLYRRNDEDPLSVALSETKAKKVPPNEWATMDANGKLVPTMGGRPYPIASGHWALRLGPDASGALGRNIVPMFHLHLAPVGAPKDHWRSDDRIVHAMVNCRSRKDDLPSWELICRWHPS